MDRKEMKEAMLRKRTLVVFGSVDDRDVEELTVNLARLNLDSDTEPIKILIDSPGGDIEAVLSFLDMLTNIRNEVTTVVTNRCFSAAVSILLAGHKRVGFEHSRFIMHQTSINRKIILDDFFESNLKEINRRGLEVRNQIEGWYVSRTKLTLEKVRELRHLGENTGQAITAKMALEFGLIHEITPKYELF
jgi:ATP-dependent protease ClpP protease subunit